MLNARFRIAAVLFFAGLTWPIAAAETPLAAIPVQTGLVVRFKSPAATIDKLAAFADQLQPRSEKPQPSEDETDPGWGDWVRYYKKSITKSYGDKVDLERDWWMFCLNPIDGESGAAFVIPATDAAALQASLAAKTEDTESIVYKTWVLSGSRAEIEAARQCIACDRQSIESRFNLEAQTVFAQGDFGAFVDVHQLTTANGVAIDEFREALTPVTPFLMEWIWEDMEPKPAVDVLRSIAGQFTDALVQGIADSDFLVVSLVLDEDDIRFENYLCVKADSTTAAFLSANPGSEMEAMSSLPPSSALYLGFQGNQKALIAWCTQLVRSISAGSESGLTKAHEEILKGYEQLNYGTIAMALPMRPVEQGILRWLTICEVDDPLRARELGLKWAALPDWMPNEAGVETPVPTRSTETYGEFSVDVAKSKNGFGIQVGDANLDKSIEAILCGPDGNTTRTLYLKDRIVECFGGSKVRTAAAIRRVVAHSNGGFVGEPHFVKTREKLGKNANLIVMIDMGGVAAVSMHLWNFYMDTMMALMNVQGDLAGAIAPNDRLMDEGVPDEPADEVQPSELQSPENPDGPDEEEPGDGNAKKVEPEVELIAEAVAEDLAKMAEVLQMKFEKEAIDSILATPSLIGISLAFEPRASRLRIVIPRQAIQQAVKAGEAMMNRFGISPVGIIDVEIEEAE